MKRILTTIVFASLLLLSGASAPASRPFDCGCTCTGPCNNCQGETSGCGSGEGILCLDTCCREYKQIMGCGGEGQ